MNVDRVSAALRSAETDIDSTYESNPLVRRNFGDAAWYFMAFCEERLLKPIFNLSRSAEEVFPHDLAALADEVVNHAKSPLRWLWKTCPAGGASFAGLVDAAYQDSWDLSLLASEYLAFESAFTYAGLGLTELSIQGNRIYSCGPLREDVRYEAYDRLMDLEEKSERIALGRVVALIAGEVSVDGRRFKYPLNPKIIAGARAICEPSLSARFRLPMDWKFPGFTLGEHAAVAKSLWMISVILFSARILAAQSGCVGMGYDQAVVVMDDEELVRRLVRYADVPEASVRAIIGDLTYGASGIRSPDIALQPLVRIAPGKLGWAPGLLMQNSLERNLIVLMNRSSDSREAYTRMSPQKEGLMRDRITKELGNLGFRFWNGTVAGWPERLDIDLAVISDAEKVCLLLELKSFIAPAEPREIKERSEEIGRGIQQVLERKRLTESRRDELLKQLQVPSEYSITWAVVSETSVGGSWVQVREVPVVRSVHLIKRLREGLGLAVLSRWLSERQYLPVEGKDYAVVAIERTVGKWKLDWYGIKGLGAEGSGPNQASAAR